MDVSKLASTSLTLSENGCGKKPHKNPHTRHSSFSEASPNKFSIIQKEEEEQVGVGRKGKEAVNPGVVA